jgi:hypothetical protein
VDRIGAQSADQELVIEEGKGVVDLFAPPIPARPTGPAKNQKKHAKS